MFVVIFVGIPKIALNKEAAVDNSLVYKHYDAKKVFNMFELLLLFLVV